jgi:hypothetical protein
MFAVAAGGFNDNLWCSSDGSICCEFGELRTDLGVMFFCVDGIVGTAAFVFRIEGWMVVKGCADFTFLVYGRYATATPMGTGLVNGPGVSHNTGFWGGSATLFVGEIKTAEEFSHFSGEFLHFFKVDSSLISEFVIWHGETDVFFCDF